MRPTERAEEDDNGMNSTTETQAEGTNPGLGTVEHDETTDTTNKGNGSASTEPENTSSESSDSESSDTESSDSDVNETGSDKSSGSNDSPDRAPDIESDEETDDGPGLESTLHRTFAPPWLNTTKANSNGVETQQQPTPKTSNDETTNERMDRIEKVLESMASAMKSLQPHNRPTSSRQDAESSWSVPLDNTTMERNSSIVRWDNIKPFPSGVPANKMWEEWNRYIENFEIAALLSNANDPAKRTQLLFLSMGPDLQEIVRAAKLRPNLSDPNCYKTFVANIQGYFRGMTDTAAEHEAFSSMKQMKDESAVAYHARLMCKVRLCGYSSEDQDRFVRAQLLKGLRNKDLVKSSRTYGYETNFIVQAATRDEAYEAETSQSTDGHVFHVERQNSSNNYRKRRNPDESIRGPYAKRRQIDQGQGRRSRCSRCNLTSHRTGKCPAIDKKCINCGKVGHFAAACRGKRVNAIRFKRENTPDDDQDDERDVEKQVLKN